MSEVGIIILIHGSRGAKAVLEIPQTLRKVVSNIRAQLPSGVKIIGAALQFNHPDLEEAIESLAANGLQKIVIVPYFLFPGRHVTEHIPQHIDKLRERFQETDFIVTNTFESDEHFIYQVMKRIREAAPEIMPAFETLTTSAEAIERESFSIVERLLPPLLETTSEEREVITRIVHASGDHQIARSVKFSPTAVISGISALRDGRQIITDVRMLAAGISNRLARACRSPVLCAIDEIGTLRPTDNTTRSAAAIHQLESKLSGAVIAIGNAPTALLALIDLIDTKEVNPALVVGMPVGFVQAKESKTELMKRDTPYISIAGTRGGSAMAAATVNALLKIAAGQNNLDTSE
jgi:precorrin-8X/cobalt-precorrin-8 methylmutase